MVTILVFALILLIVVIGHELGHFFVAKWCGVRVEEFGFGLPPKIWGYRPKDSETEYTLNALPIGGFVRLYGEDGEERQSPRSFAAQHPAKKIAILTAGVIMNLIIAWVAFTIVGLMGSLSIISEDQLADNPEARTIVTQVAPESPAEEQGLRFGDQIVSINGDQVVTPSDIREIIGANQGQTLSVDIQRGSTTETIEVLARENAPEDQGSVGISMQLVINQRVGLLQAMQEAVMRIWTVVVTTITILSQMIGSWIVPGVEVPAEADVRGPVGMVSAVGEFRQLGLSYVITFVGLISTSLALFNILPIPALDGGRIVFVAIEWIKGSPVKAEWEAAVHTTGFMLVIGLSILITIRDVINLF